jgi:hypothetical protein
MNATLHSSSAQQSIHHTDIEKEQIGYTNGKLPVDEQQSCASLTVFLTCMLQPTAQ